MSSFENRRVVATNSGNEGIGYHLLSSLVEDGYRVAGLDINGEHVRALQKKRPEQTPFLECDIIEDADVETAVEAIIDGWDETGIHVNNTGTNSLLELKLGSDWIDGVIVGQWP